MHVPKDIQNSEHFLYEKGEKEKKKGKAISEIIHLKTF